MAEDKKAAEEKLKKLRETREALENELDKKLGELNTASEEEQFIVRAGKVIYHEEEATSFRLEWVEDDSDESSGDSAMLTKNPGGIDLNSNILNMNIQRDGKGIALPAFQQPIENINVDGFIPLIINVVPITNLPLIIGIVDTEKKLLDPFDNKLQVSSLN